MNQKLNFGPTNKWTGLDFLKLFRLPPKFTKVCCPIHERWAPVSIKQVELLGPVMWKFTEPTISLALLAI